VASKNRPIPASFAEVSQQSEAELRHWLQLGPPPIRVYAAWALGVRMSQAVLPHLVSHMTHEPNPGVRRQLIIILAGGKEYDTLIALALHDSDPSVRATACQYLARLAEPTDSALYEVLMERMVQDSVEIVRSAVIEHLRSDAPVHVQALVETRLLMETLEVQKLVLERLLAWSDGPGAFLAHTHDLPMPLVVHALVLLREKAVGATWLDVAKVASSGDWDVCIQVARLLASQPQSTPRDFWLGLAEHWAAHGYHHTGPDVLDLIVNGFEQSYMRFSPEKLPDEEMQRLNMARKSLERGVRRGTYGCDKDWLNIIGLLNNPKMAGTMPWNSPLARLLVQLIRLTPSYPGFTKEELAGELLIC
jgi:hypothetical protein